MTDNKSRPGTEPINYKSFFTYLETRTCCIVLHDVVLLKCFEALIIIFTDDSEPQDIVVKCPEISDISVYCLVFVKNASNFLLLHDVVCLISSRG